MPIRMNDLFKQPGEVVQSATNQSPSQFISRWGNKPAPEAGPSGTVTYATPPLPGTGDRRGFGGKFNWFGMDRFDRRHGVPQAAITPMPAAFTPQVMRGEYYALTPQYLESLKNLGARTEELTGRDPFASPGAQTDIYRTGLEAAGKQQQWFRTYDEQKREFDTEMGFKEKALSSEIDYKNRALAQERDLSLLKIALGQQEVDLNKQQFEAQQSAAETQGWMSLVGTAGNWLGLGGGGSGTGSGGSSNIISSTLGSILSYKGGGGGAAAVSGSSSSGGLASGIGGTGSAAAEMMTPAQATGATALSSLLGSAGTMSGTGFAGGSVMSGGSGLLGSLFGSSGGSGIFSFLQAGSVGGTLFGGASGYMIASAISKKWKDKQIKMGGKIGGSILGAIGSYFFGPIGGMIGGTIGTFIGGGIAKLCKGVKRYIKKIF